MGAFGLSGWDHDAGVLVEPVELFSFGEEFGHCWLDRGEVGEVDREEMEVAFGVGVLDLNVFNAGFGFGFGAAGDPDCGVVLIEDGG